MLFDNIRNRSHRLEVIVCLFLILTTLIVYWQLPNCDFISLDDGVYVSENVNVNAGLSRKGFAWAFTIFDSANWHPLTWLSHMLDCELFGLNPGMHHLTNLLFHIANTLLLFLVLRRMTGAIWRSAFVAALFALHPLHVESVAWVSERKDVLSTFFWFLTMWAYMRYAERPGLSRYILVLIFFLLGLMSKPMVVTLPLVLFLMDLWPLKRIELWKPGKGWDLKSQKLILSRLVWEKAPLFLLAAASCVITFLSEQGGGAVRPLEVFTVKARLANALISYISYMGKMIWPWHLAIFYPHPVTIPLWQLVGAGALLGWFSVMAVTAARRFPYILVGWLWYLVTTLPVIGLVQVGDQAMADRYTYIPSIGLFIPFVWCLGEFTSKWGGVRVVVATCCVVIVLSFMTCTWFQVRHWKDSVTLFSHAIDVITDNYPAHNSLGVSLEKEGRLEDAIFHYSEAVKIAPAYAAAHNNLGRVLAIQGRLDRAVAHFQQAVQLRPNWAMAHYNLGVARAEQGRLDEAIRHYNEALRIRPNHVMAHNNLGIALANQGNLKEAVRHFSEAINVRPGDTLARRNLEKALRLLQKSEEAHEITLP